MPERENAFRLFALTPAGMADPSVAIAAARAGAVGVLNLEFASDSGASLRALERMARHGRGERGILIDAENAPLAEEIRTLGDGLFHWVLLTSSSRDALQREIALWRARPVRILVQAIHLHEANAAVEAGADGVIAKGAESGGRVGEETSFILLQRFLRELDVEIYAQGGIGPRTAAACRAAGAAGVVLDSQLALARESQLSAETKRAIGAMDGGETDVIEGPAGERARLFSRGRLPRLEEFQAVAAHLRDSLMPAGEALGRWKRALAERVGWNSPEENLLLLGQDAALAAPLAKRYATVGGIIEAVRTEADRSCATAARLRPLAEGSALAQSHGTRYPIVQGPMTRVSDKASFAAAVADAGGLPTLALAVMRGGEIRTLLKETVDALGDRPWGVGILGFLPLELRKEQVDAMREFRPAFAVLAGGRPEQANALDAEGVATYVHAPSPAILRMLYQAGARRFVFEGRECGGHVGPRSSFCLWEQCVEELLERIGSRENEAEQCHVLFAGGIHDGRSAAMVEALAAPLAERGVRVGALIGTAYLFTREAVESGAIVEGFQREALDCAQTVLLESGPGHSTRCAPTPFADAFLNEKRRLLAEARSSDEIRLALEQLNIGRLRIAAKGQERDESFERVPKASKLKPVAPDRQRREGLYMMGQAAALRDSISSIEDIHREIATGGERLAAIRPLQSSASSILRGEKPPVAIVGMSCFLPKAPDLASYWHNIRHKVDAIQEVPEERWDWRLYYDPDPRAKDKIYSKWGGFLDDILFDPTVYGMPPNALESIDPVQLLALEAVRQALADAGYAERPFPRETTSVILGAGGVGELATRYGTRAALPRLFNGQHETALLAEELRDQLPQWTEDTFPGVLLNVIAGRIANRFNLGGLNFTVDAACASSLAAVELAVKELQTGSSDMVIAGGIDTNMSPYAYLCFSKTYAFSPRGRCQPLSAEADGIVISEGAAMTILKRLDDAIRDGDRIYAVIRGIAGSSDGRAKGLTAPHPDGQIRALRRAYENAGVSPASIEYLELHGTGTVVGDMAEIETVQRVFEGGVPRRCAVGSVKSMIGHTKCAAGVVSLLKVALALHHKVLPPTLGVDRPNPKADSPASPVYVNTEARPWLRRDPQVPRRAAVSAFGFGGTNFHAVLEEYDGEFLEDRRRTLPGRRPAELFLWRAASRVELAAAVKDFRSKAAASDPKQFAQWAAWAAAAYENAGEGLCLAVVAESPLDLDQKLERAVAFLEGAEGELADPRGLYFSETPLAREGKIAFLLPGQGSQYVNMAAELAMDFPAVRECIERAGVALRDRLPRFLGQAIYPPSAFTDEEKRAQEAELTATQVAQPALGAVSLGMARLLESFGIQPDLLAGHSYGELAALCLAGAFDEDALYLASEARGRAMAEAAGSQPGAMAAVDAPIDEVAPVANSIESLHVANLNGPRQTIVAGPDAAVDEAVRAFAEKGLRARRISVACAFHTPIVAPARERFLEFLSGVEIASPRVPVFSNTTAEPYPSEPAAIAARLGDHLVNPVRFQEEIEALHAAGARLFVEVGPKAVLTGLVRQILEGKRFLAVNTDQPGRPGFLQLAHALGQLAAHGVSVKASVLFEGRVEPRAPGEKPPAPPAMAWLVNGYRARPLRETPKAAARVKPTAAAKPAVTEERKEPASAAPLPARVEPAASSAPSEAAAPSGSDVMAQFQRIMNRFLDVQREVMEAYLAASSGRPIQAAASASQPSSAPPIQAIAAPAEHAGGACAAEPDSRPLRPAAALARSGGTDLQGTDAPPLDQPAGLSREDLTARLLA
ncbi:MAG: beta-ketoacyl synthase N-terminal-like domain-containing protein, partial [Candidatus Sumerlaeota bacterium]|nr:beta-ketoacyl synthase N-terminal-like domain-containing protein [Candidatus Sumerlaeota bacterium]